MADAEQPNLVFMMTDHQRADSLGMVQSGAEVTPNLNRLAEGGTAFSRAYTTCPLCVPARTALATGLYPTRNGEVVNDWRGRDATDCKPIHQYLAEAGYEVAHIGVHHIRVAPELRERVDFSKWVSTEEHVRYLSQRDMTNCPGEQKDFQREVVENQGGEGVKVRYSGTRCVEWPHDADHFKDAYFCSEAVEFINRPHSRPFALFLYLWAPHPPFWVPEPYASRFQPERITLPANVGTPTEGEPPGRRRGIAAQLAEGLSEEEWRQVWAAHLGLVNLADEGLGRVLSALDEQGLRENTLVSFTVDHGDHLGQHQMYQKMEMYEQAIRIPLIFSGPGVRNQRFNTPVSHLDVVPTLLEMLGLSPDTELDGQSLASSLTRNQTVTPRPVFAQYSGNPVIGDTRRCVVSGQYKYVFDPDDAPELYDLEVDPLEMTNIAAQDPSDPAVKELHETLSAWGTAHGDWVQY